MRDYIIITDSIADLPKIWLAENPDITIIDTPINTEGELDYMGPMSIEEFATFVEFCKERKTKLKTSSPPLREVKNALISAIHRGKNALYISMAGALSSTYQHVSMLCNDMNNALVYDGNPLRVHCVDSQCVTGGLGLLVQNTYYFANTLEKAVNYVNAHSRRMQHLFTVTDFSQLEQSGRASHLQTIMIRATKSILGRINLYPVLGFEPDQSGKKQAKFIKMVHGEKQLIKFMVNHLKRELSQIPGRIIIAYGAGMQKRAEQLQYELQKSIPNFRAEEFWRIGPEVSCHVGPQAVGIFYEKA